LAAILHPSAVQARIPEMRARRKNMKKCGKHPVIQAVLLASLVAACLIRSSAAQTAEASAPPQHRILISVPDRELVLEEDGVVQEIYPVAVGKSSTPSPAGSFTIVRRVSNPTYSHRGKTVAPGPKNPVGSRWIGLNIKGYGIHGTNEPNSIGKAASHGCIRMAKSDLEDLYALVQVGDIVEIHAQHDAAIEQALNPAPPPTESPTPAAVLVAANSQTQP
jgi:lipoprotein-anchoring transpeptidase ErfK/SrfK